MLLSVARVSALVNALAANAGRFNAPSGSRMSSPNASTSAASPSVPGSTTSRAITSPSTTTPPHCENVVETADLPAPMPPVSPIRSIDSYAVGLGATGELLPQRGELRVAGQRATLRLFTRRAVGLRPLVSFGLGRGELLHLRGVHLVPALGLGVARFPFGALHVEILEPLVGFGVETLREDVVALLVIAVGHAVLGRVEFLGVVLVGLLERQRDTATLQVDVDDLDHRVVADGDHLVGHLHVTLGQLGDVHQALDALLDADERTERHQFGDLAGHDLADRVGAGEVPPRVFLSRLERQRNPLAVHVDVEHLDGNLVADLNHLGGVVDVLPRQLGDVHQTVDATEIDERAEVDDRGHHTLADGALLQLVEELAADLGLGLLEPGAAGQHHVVAVLVQLDDLGFDLLADVRLQIADASHLDQRGGQEAAQPDVEDQAALDDLDDGALDGLVLLLERLDGAPGALVLRALLGQDQPAFFVLLGEDQGFDFITHGNDLIGVDVVLDGQFAGGDDPLGLVADVEQDLVPVNLDDGPFDDVAIVEVLDCFVDGGEKILARANVVDGYLRRGDGGTRHIVGLLRTGWGRRDKAGSFDYPIPPHRAARSTSSPGYLSRLLDCVHAGQTASHCVGRALTAENSPIFRRSCTLGA